MSPILTYSDNCCWSTHVSDIMVSEFYNCNHRMEIIFIYLFPSNFSCFFNFIFKNMAFACFICISHTIYLIYIFRRNDLFKNVYVFYYKYMKVVVQYVLYAVMHIIDNEFLNQLNIALKILNTAVLNGRYWADELW